MTRLIIPIREDRLAEVLDSYGGDRDRLVRSVLRGFDERLAKRASPSERSTPSTTRNAASGNVREVDPRWKTPAKK